VRAGRSIPAVLAATMGVAACTNTAAAPAPSLRQQATGTVRASSLYALSPTTAPRADAPAVDTSTPTGSSSATPTTWSADASARPVHLTGKQKACLTAAPATLRARVTTGWELPIPGHRFWALAVVGDRVYGDGGPDDAIYMADTGTRTVRKISTESGQSGVGWMAANEQTLTWLTYDSASDPSKWSLYVSDPQGAGVRKVAGSSEDQADGQGRATQPALVQDRLAWTEWRQSSDTFDLRVLNLSTGKATTVATGELAPPVAMGDLFVWPQQAKSQEWTFRAVDASTLHPVRLPAGLPTYDGGIGQVAATTDRLIWGSSDYLNLNVWDRRSGRVDRYQTDTSSGHVFQFMKPTGNLLTWDASWPYSLMDVRTGRFYDVGKDVGLAAGDGRVAISWMSKLDGQKSGQRGRARLTVLRESEVPLPAGDCTG
jgi:hypothetical protein